MTTQNSQGQTQEHAQAAPTTTGQVRAKVKHKNSPAPLLLSLGGVGLAGLGVAMVTLQGPLGDLTTKLVKNGVQPGMLFLTGAMLGGLALVSRQHNRAQQAINNRGGSVHDLSTTIANMQFGLDELRAHSTPLAAEVHALRTELHSYTSTKEEQSDQAGIFQVAGSVDKLAARVDQNMKSFGQEMEERLSAISARVDQSSVEVRERVESLGADEGSQNAVLEVLQERFGQVEASLTRMQAWEARLDQQSEHFQAIQSALADRGEREGALQSSLEQAVQTSVKECLQASLAHMLQEGLQSTLTTSLQQELPGAVASTLSKSVEQAVQDSLDQKVSPAVASAVADHVLEAVARRVEETLHAEWPNTAWEGLRGTIEATLEGCVTAAVQAQASAAPAQPDAPVVVQEESLEPHQDEIHDAVVAEDVPQEMDSDAHTQELGLQEIEAEETTPPAPVEETQDAQPQASLGLAPFAWMQPKQESPSPQHQGETEGVEEASHAIEPVGESPAQIERIFEAPMETSLPSPVEETSLSPTETEVHSAFSQAFGESSEEEALASEAPATPWELAQPETALPEPPVSQQFPLEYVAPSETQPNALPTSLESQAHQEQPPTEGQEQQCNPLAHALDHLYQLDEPMPEEGVRPTAQAHGSETPPMHEGSREEHTEPAEPLMDFQRDATPALDGPHFLGSEPAGIPGAPDSPFPTPVPLNQEPAQPDLESDPEQRLEEPPAALPYEAPRNPLRFRFPKPNQE